MSLFVQPAMQYVDLDGAPLSFGQAKFSEAGTTTPVEVYQDNGFVNPHVDPVVANAQGIWPPIYINPALGPVRCRIIPSSGNFTSPLIDADPADNLFALGGVTNSYLAAMAAGTLKGNLTAGAATPADNNSDAVTNFLRVGAEAQVGVLALATTAEAVLGANTSKAVTSAGVAAAIAAVSGPGSSSLITNGYQEFTGGLVLQWGRVGPVAVDGFNDIVFPIAFPTACLNFQHSPSVPLPYSIRMDSWSLRADPPSTTGVRVYVASSANSQAVSIDWFAIGH